MRTLVEVQRGASAEFEVTFAWEFAAQELVNLGPGNLGEGEWLGTRPHHTVAVTFQPRATPGESMQPSELYASRVELVELSVYAEGPPNTSFGWSGGPLAGNTALVQAFASEVERRTGLIAYLAPRRIQPGLRGSTPAEVLTPTGENLTDVIYYLQTNEPQTGFVRLREFMQLAFPQIRDVTARAMPGQPGHELHVIYAGAEDRLIPLSQWGTGVEQMLALGTAVLTHPEPRVFLIDEPQAYLHPHAERSLEEFLREHAQHQYVIATHSAVFLASHRLIQTRLVSMVDGRSRIVQPDDRVDCSMSLG